jgi:hypothetical protein
MPFCFKRTLVLILGGFDLQLSKTCVNCDILLKFYDNPLRGMGITLNVLPGTFNRLTLPYVCN